MRWTVMALALGLATGVAACGQGEQAAPGDAAKTAVAPPAAGPAAFPSRAPGLWRQTMSMGQTQHSSRICLDAAVERQVSLLGQGMSGCTGTPPQRTAGGYGFTSSCDMGQAGVITTKGVVTGDFAKAYRVDAQSTTTGAASAQMNGDHAMVIEAVNEGPCPADFAPGDIEMPGGVKMNILAMAKLAPPKP